MKEETEFKPKPLVEIGGRPILWHIMKIYQHYGYKEFILTLGYKGNMIKEYFLNARTFVNDFTLKTKDNAITLHTDGHDDLTITFVDTGLNTLTGERIRKVKDYIGGSEFMVTYGDGVGNIDIPKLLEFHRGQKTAGTITGVHPLSRFGVMDVDEKTSKVTNFKQFTVVSMARDESKFEEFRHTHRKDYINGGFMVFNNRLFDYLNKDSMIEETFVPMIQAGELSLYKHEGPWKAMDTYKDVEELNLFWQKDPFWKVW